MLPALASAARPMVRRIGELAEAARSMGIQVVHATFQTTAHGRSPRSNVPLFAATERHTAEWVAGSAPVQVVSELGIGPDDLVMPRHHGVSPTQGTELLPLLRTIGAETLVVTTGVSLNIAIPSVVVDAVNEGFRVIVPTDAVAGTPLE
ncbi:MAG: isochorismatase family protein, partial [Pseudonocardiaceae bacterium]|nr:isochorismatase family protein [Pseudonocardiaceae bacterium]